MKTMRGIKNGLVLGGVLWVILWLLARGLDRVAWKLAH